MYMSKKNGNIVNTKFEIILQIIECLFKYHIFDLKWCKVETIQKTKTEETKIPVLTETVLTVGLFKKGSEILGANPDDAKIIISNMLINDFEIDGMTITDCYGVYRMQDTGNIVREPSIRIEIVSDKLTDEIINKIIARLKDTFHQETIMYKSSPVNVSFI